MADLDHRPDPALATTPPRLWTLARQAAEHGWTVTIHPASRANRKIRLHLDSPGRDAITVTWSFWYKTQPGGPGTWRLEHAAAEPRRGHGGSRSQTRIPWHDVLWYATNPGSNTAPDDGQQ